MSIVRLKKEDFDTIRVMYRQAKYPKKQIKILFDMFPYVKTKDIRAVACGNIEEFGTVNGLCTVKVLEGEK